MLSPNTNKKRQLLELNPNNASLDHSRNNSSNVSQNKSKSVSLVMSEIDFKKDFLEERDEDLNEININGTEVMETESSNYGKSRRSKKIVLKRRLS